MALKTIISLLCGLLSARSFVSRQTFASRKNASTRLREKEAKETLNFNVDFSYTSDLLPSSSVDVHDFFRKKTTRDFMVSIGGTRQVEELPITAELKDAWKESCDRFHSANFPNDTDDESVVSALSEAQFPGMKLQTSVLNGIKKIAMEDGTQGYETHLLAQKQEAYGPPPLVWIFNKLTGNADKEKGKFYPSSGKSISRVSVLEKEGGCVFHWDCKLHIKVEFPAVLVRILPVKKEKMEEQGSAAIQKAVEKDIRGGVDATRELFLKWADNSIVV